MAGQTAILVGQMKGTDTIRGNDKAERNINGLYSFRMKRGLTSKDLSQLSGINTHSLSDYETGKNVPTVKNYNKLAEVFGWEKILPTTRYVIKKKRANPDEDDLCEDLYPPEAITLPLKPEYKFEKGHKYLILESEKDEKSPIKDCVFQYEGKQGIHHMFREERGKWTRTYTDAQLIGKLIKEVK